MDFLNKYSSYIVGISRIMAGLLFVEHGTIKLFHFPTSMMGGTVVMIAGAIELVGGAMVAAGFFSRYAAFICSGEMAVAYFMAHAPRGFYPAMNGGDAAVLFCFIFLLLAAVGPGSFAVNRK